jgi:hypothetical protein
MHDSIALASRVAGFDKGHVLTLLMQANFYKCHQHGAPLKAMQHPLHYPHGTLFMAPGPAGQTAAIPNDKGLKRLMLREFHNYNVTFSSYNFDYKPASDSLMAKALRWWERQQALRKREEALEAKIADQQMRRCALRYVPPHTRPAWHEAFKFCFQSGLLCRHSERALFVFAGLLGRAPVPNQSSQRKVAKVAAKASILMNQTFWLALLSQSSQRMYK